jgi:flagellar assembly factor FliW
MKVNTVRFGNLEVSDSDVITFADGLLGFEHLKRFFIVDPSDDTLILWLQSMESPEVAFPILEPKIFKADYKVRLSANELRLLRLEGVRGSSVLVYSILTIPEDVTTMTANLKAPIVINAADQRGRQVVLQENDYTVRYAIYKELLAVIMSAANARGGSEKTEEGTAVPLSLRTASSKVEVTAL